MNGKKGFTLLEVMVALAILAIALVAVFQLQSQNLSLAEEVRFLTTASLLAQGKMAEIEAIKLKDLRAGEGDFGDEFPDYRWRLEVKDTVLTTLKKIELTVQNLRLKARGAYTIELYKFVEG